MRKVAIGGAYVESSAFGTSTLLPSSKLANPTLVSVIAPGATSVTIPSLNAAISISSSVAAVTGTLRSTTWGKLGSKGADWVAPQSKLSFFVLTSQDLKSPHELLQIFTRLAQLIRTRRDFSH